ncbi:MAG: DNA mismatch repair protein MutS [Oscillospiraceae bacterium]|nr:DNA mismatch repair protein MutS [Oscillospiraceae bacterium]
MLKQYLEIKKDYKDYILFFRLGDFYEMFFDDAKTVARELELALTARAGSPMCGVPYFSAEEPIKNLIARGYKVAICEQLTDPKESKGLVERGVVRLLTKGTVIESSMLSEDSNNYLTCIYSDSEGAGLAFADVSTGDVHVFEKRGTNIQSEIIAELSRFNPSELLINNGFCDLKEVHTFVKNKLYNCSCELFEDKEFDNSDLSVITEQFENKSGAEALGIAAMPLAQKALCVLFRYIGETHRVRVKRFVEIEAHTGSEFMGLSLSAQNNLEITRTMRGRERRGSLLWVLDQTVTAMGRRRLVSWVERPLVKHTQILARLDALEELTENSAQLCDIREAMNGIYDLERLMTRIVYKTASPRDIYSFGKTCRKLPVLKHELSGMKSRLLTELYGRIDELTDIAVLVENAIDDDPPNSLKDGGVIKAGFNDEIDRLRDITGGGESIMREIEQREREATGIRTLKVGNNRVFGYYIEVSNSFKDQVPEHYIRRQTLTNGERFITEELKKVEGEILGAHDKILALEQAVFNEVRGFIATKLTAIQETAEAVSMVDALCSMAQVSLENGYVKPEISADGVIEIKDGRHPVVEKLLLDHPFTPNDVYLDSSDNRMLIITGPNMSGKSTFMRQTAIIVIMAQIGCFVPAKYARIGVVDQIFTRVGASDDLSAGQSTFMVEMTEVAEILNNATDRSLVILDEIGRGTSTFDGISIAKSVAEYISQKLRSKTLFATHYHELITMEKEQDGIRNFSVAVSKRGDELKFLHKIVPGGTDDSYGIEVAKLAGLPNKVIKRAKEELKELEVSGKIRLSEVIEKNKDNQFSFTAVNEQNAVAKLRAVDINTMSPMDALMFVKDLKESLN